MQVVVAVLGNPHGQEKVLKYRLCCSALSAAEREIETYHQHRYRQTRRKPSPVHPDGTIARVFRAKGYGYIQTADSQIYFHREVLEGLAFDDIQKGLPVSFELGAGENGPRAVRVFAVGNSRS